jgi:3-oxoadipate enol-lactonase
MPRIPVRTGISLFYEDFGAGPPLLMLDGPGASWVWVNNVPELSRHFQVITLDVRGTGRSDKPPPPYSIAQMAQETADVITGLGLGRTNLVGLSEGGAISQELALTFPELAGRLVLIGTTPGGALQVPTPPTTLAQGAPLPFLDPVTNAQRRLSTVLSPAWVLSHPAEFQTLTALALQNPTPEFARLAQAAAAATWPGIVGRSQFLQSPALVLAGTQDQLVPPINAVWLANLLPNARLQFFPGAGHLVQVEQPAAFNQAVTAFLLAP